MTDILKRALSALAQIRDAEAFDGDSFVCDFYTLQSIAGAVLREADEPRPPEPAPAACEQCAEWHRWDSQRIAEINATRRERDAATLAAKANAKECETLRGAVDNWIALAQSRGREVDHLVNQRIKLARELAGSDVRISNLIAERDELAARLSDAIRERNAMREYVRALNPTCVIE